MGEGTIEYEQRSAVALITLSRSEKANAMTPATRRPMPIRTGRPPPHRGRDDPPGDERHDGGNRSQD